MPQPLPNGENLSPQQRMRRLISLWAGCCFSPILYLATAAFLKSYLMPPDGWLPLEPFTWSRLFMGLLVWLILLQGLHLAVKLFARKQMNLAVGDTEIFFRILTHRTFLLLGLSEAAIAVGFCLFLLQGNYKPLLYSGIAAMLLYGLSHPRLALPPDSPI